MNKFDKLKWFLELERKISRLDLDGGYTGNTYLIYVSPYSHFFEKEPHIGYM